VASSYEHSNQHSLQKRWGNSWPSERLSISRKRPHPVPLVCGLRVTSWRHTDNERAHTGYWRDVCCFCKLCSKYELTAVFLLKRDKWLLSCYCCVPDFEHPAFIVWSADRLIMNGEWTQLLQTSKLLYAARFKNKTSPTLRCTWVVCITEWVGMCVCERVCVGMCMCVCECLKTQLLGHMKPCQLVFTDVWEELVAFMFECKDNSFWVCLLVLD
jgi:hypothetical protein